MIHQMLFGGGLPRAAFQMTKYNAPEGAGGWSGVRDVSGTVYGSFSPSSPMLGPSVITELYSLAGSGGTDGTWLRFASPHPYTGAIKVNSYTLTRNSDTEWYTSFDLVFIGTGIVDVTVEQQP